MSVTAIRNRDLDGNDATERDRMDAFNATPMRPEYPSAAAIVASVAAASSSPCSARAQPVHDHRLRQPEL